jgi:hypothetical protein
MRQTCELVLASKNVVMRSPRFVLGFSSCGPRSIERHGIVATCTELMSLRFFVAKGDSDGFWQAWHERISTEFKCEKVRSTLRQTVSINKI